MSDDDNSNGALMLVIFMLLGMMVGALIMGNFLWRWLGG